MIKTISASELDTIAESQAKEKSYLQEVAKNMRAGAKVLVRLYEKANGKTLKIYTYDRYLYRYVCTDKIDLQ